ncbi:tetratricopeptide repeat protein [Paenibacillus solisilvae]|uniref:Tetratricopeptide repeat protein n=1 Tax=Paenibacillus solisilvae TaxID=2486751 RepID=A0ABW0VY24_9BACL
MSLTILFHHKREGGMQKMFKHVFASMKEKLNEIMIHYPHANEDQKKLHDEQLSMLRQFSDTFIEEWLQFEEIMADFRELQLSPSLSSSNLKAEPPDISGIATNQAAAAGEVEQMPEALLNSLSSGCTNDPGTAGGNHECAGESEADYEQLQTMLKGQGYFKLFMFREAAKHFQEAVRRWPDDNKARLFLAMTYMHVQEWNEAQRHFQLLVEVTDDSRWRALGLNALGCIQAVRMNLEQAATYFQKAHEADPDFADPLSNMKSCQQQTGHLSLFFGSGLL